MNRPWPSTYKVDAFISEDGLFRYFLEIKWDESLPMMAFVLYNPSKASHLIDDPTALRVVGFAKREKCGGVVIANLHAYRATDPKELLKVGDSVGPSNGPTLMMIAQRFSKIVVGWGAGQRYHQSLHRFLAATSGHELLCLGVTKSGDPRHPLYLRADTPLVKWTPA